MKVRKLAVALALAGGLGSGVAQALGLGEIELQSFLNEPLDAEINLRKSEGVSPGDVFVNIAPQSAFERVGINRSYFLTKLNFQVTTAPNGSLVVNVSTREPLREPYLNFLVEVTWPNGRLMREYAVLVDPPVYSEESGVTEQISAPATSQSQQARQPASAQATRDSGQTNAGQVRSTVDRTSGARTLGPTNSADTLWTIAAQTRPNSNVSMQQMMLAIQELNPDAFIGGNINRLKRGEILRIPDENQIRSRGRAQANQEVAAQNRAFSSPQRTVDATGESAAVTVSEAAGSSGGDQLRLMAEDDTASRDAEDGGSAGGDGDTAGGMDAGGSAVAMEQLESARRENDELSGRVDDLQDQVQTLQRLLELKNSQLAEVQNTQSELAGDPEMLREDSAENTAESAVESAVESAAEIADESSDESATEDAGESVVESSESADAEMASDADAIDVVGDSDAQQVPQEAGESAAPSVTDETAAESAAEVQVEPETAAEPEPVAEVTPESAPEPAQKPFPGNIIDAISNNVLYQVALGGGLVVLLLLLLLLARRNANREKAFYDQLNSESEGDESDSFDLTFDEDESAETPEEDAIAEADAYIAYGRNDQAAHTLETAISREPSRSDLRLKLLGVYADIQDRESFDKQFREIEALDDEAAITEAMSLQGKLEEAESMPSIDDLESQLRSGGADSVESEKDESESPSYDSDYDLEPWEEPEKESSEKSADDELSSELDFEDMDLDLPDAENEQPKAGDSGDDRDDMIEYDLSDLEAEEDSSPDREQAEKAEKPDDNSSRVESDDLDEPFDFSLEEGDLPEDDKADVDEDDDLSLDFDTSDLEVDDKPDSTADNDKAEVSPTSVQADDLEIEGDGELDESFLDDLDAELDKVANEDEVAEKDDESELDDLELDVSDEDLALMEEFSESDEEGPSDAPEQAEDDELSLDDELGLEDALKGEDAASPDLEVEGSEQADDSIADAVVPPVASKPSPADDSESELDEADLGDDDDFDFLAGTDEAATKLDLARAYVEMGDVDGARDILEEVALEGNDEQKAEAQDLLKNLS